MYNFEKDAKNGYELWTHYKRLEKLLAGAPTASDEPIIQIDNCILIHGDAREWLPRCPYDAIVTDPPYGMALKNGTNRFKAGKILNDDTTELLTWICNQPATHSKYIFMRWDNLYDVPKPKSFITWLKDNHSVGDLEHEHGRMTESIAFYPGKAHSWANKRPYDHIKCPRADNTHHPMAKPVPLLQAILSWIPKNQCIVDPFMGAGATALAARQSGHPFIGIELDPKHYKTTLERLNEPHQPQLEGLTQ